MFASSSQQAFGLHSFELDGIDCIGATAPNGEAQMPE
jgi:hypothetical protein